MLKITGVRTECVYKIGGDFFAVFLLAAKIFGVEFFYPDVYGEAVGFVKTEKADAIGDFIAYAANF